MSPFAHTEGPLFPDSAPIFVTGAARSGTSVVCDALRFGAGIPGNRESYLFSTCQLLVSHLDREWQRLRVPLQFFADADRGDPRHERALARFCYPELVRHILTYFHDLSAPADCETWVDKTPDLYMVSATPTLAAEYPRARWVFVKRSGIAVVDSRKRTAPEATFEDSCTDWAAVMLAWREVRGDVEDRAIEVDQHDVAMRPRQVARELARFLGFDEEKQGGIADHFASATPGRTTERPLDVEPTLASVQWSKRERATFRRLCGEAMAAFGYAL